MAGKLKRNLLAAFFTCIAAGAGTTYYALEIEPKSFHISEQAVQTANMDEELSGLRVAVMADLHAGARFIDLDHVRDVVRDINAANPDIVLMPGDFINSGHEWGSHYDDFTEEQIVEELSKIKAPKIATHGNHEYIRKKHMHPDALAELFRANDITFLDNQSAAIETRLGTIWIAGLDDAYRGRPDYDATFDGIPEDASILYMTHNPDGFLLLDRPVALAVAGDTHCGQVNIFGIRPAAYIKGEHIKTLERWTCGLYDDLPHNNQGLVSNGVGTSNFPVRIGTPPQVEILTLEHGQ